MPPRASPISASNCSWLNGSVSAVPWTSTMPPVAGHHEIGVRVGFGVLGVVEIEHGLAAIEAAGDGRHVVAQDTALDHVARLHPGERVVERHPGAGNRGGARAAVGLQHVAVDDDLLLAERLKDRSPRASERPIRR